MSMTDHHRHLRFSEPEQCAHLVDFRSRNGPKPFRSLHDCRKVKPLGRSRVSTHVADHAAVSADHQIAVDVDRAELFCCICGDQVYDKDFDTAVVLTQLAAATLGGIGSISFPPPENLRKQRRVDYRPWSPDNLTSHVITVNSQTNGKDQNLKTAEANTKKDVYSVWALPPEDLTARIRKLMVALRSEFGGPEFEPHVTVVGAISLTEAEARDKFRSACEGLKSYTATVEKVSTGTFFYQCVFLLLHPTDEVVKVSAHCSGHFGFKSSTPYMPHLSILYADLTEEEKKKAHERAIALDESLSGLSFKVSRIALYKTDTEDKTLKSWEKVVECNLDNNK